MTSRVRLEISAIEERCGGTGSERRTCNLDRHDSQSVRLIDEKELAAIS